MTDYGPYMTLLVGLAIITGVKYWWLWFRAFLQRILNPPVKEVPVPHWTWCQYGGYRGEGHRVRTESAAWDNDNFICDDCLHDRDYGL